MSILRESQIDILTSINNYNFIDVSLFQALLISSVSSSLSYDRKGFCRQSALESMSRSLFLPRIEARSALYIPII